MSVAYRTAGPSDEPFLRALYGSTREAELAMTPWDEPQRQAFIAHQFAAQQQHYQRHYPSAQHLVLMQTGAPVGRLYVDRGPERLHILDLTIAPAHRGQGVGGAVLQDLIAEAAAHGRPVSIYVESESPALRLFERLGFQPVQESGFRLLLEWRPGVTGAHQPAGVS